MSGKYTYLFSFSFMNNEIKIYRNDKFLIMETDKVTQHLIKGITIENDVICSKIILNNSYVYLPDIKYVDNNNIIEALIQRDNHIELIVNKKNLVDKNIYKKKNLLNKFKNIKSINSINSSLINVHS